MPPHLESVQTLLCDEAESVDVDGVLYVLFAFNPCEIMQEF